MTDLEDLEEAMKDVQTRPKKAQNFQSLEEEDILKEVEQEEYEDDFADEEDAYQIIEKELKKKE
jgi:hypothetical protein